MKYVNYSLLTALVVSNSSLYWLFIRERIRRW